MYTSYKQSLAMADQFQTGIYGENWWNSSKSTFGSSLCSTPINDIGSFGWPSELVDIKARSCDESCSISDESMMLQDMQKPQQPDSVSGSDTSLMDSTWQTMGPTDCNKASLGRAQSNYHYPMLQEDMNSGLDCPQIQKEWNSSNLGQDSSIDAFKPMNQLGFSLDEPCLNSVTSSGNCTPACQGIATSFPMSSASYQCPSKLFQTLFDIEPQPQQSLFDKPSMNNPNYRTNLNGFSPPLPKFSPLLNPSMPKQEPANHFLFNNNTPFYKSQLLASTFEEKPNCPNFTAKSGKEDVQFMSSVMKNSSSEPAVKRQRFDTPSPLPTFKVRKEKLGDRVTALQQLVSPFGKTDTASVLHEAILYIKFLHDQVRVLTGPYMKNGPPIQHQQTCDNLKIDSEGPKQELRSRGLCLVPISSTFPVVNQTTADFWTPSF